jgi:arylsulfatase A-like enzyme
MKRPPNILIICTDQHRNGFLGLDGARVQTPSLDALAQKGIRFTRSYCTTPLCCPSRSSFVTGLMPHSTGVTTNGIAVREGIPNIGSVLRGAGYETAWTGQYDLPMEYPLESDPTPGFDYLPYQDRDTAGGGYPLRIKGHPDNWKYETGTFSDRFTAANAERFISRKHEKPFLLVVSFTNPHDICFTDLYDREGDIPTGEFPSLPVNHEPPVGEPDMLAQTRWTHEGSAAVAKGWDGAGWRRSLAIYSRLVNRVDKEIGKVISAIEKAGLVEDTAIIYSADHGEGGASHKWLGKLSPYEESVGVPMVVSWPGHLPAGVVDNRSLVSGVDIMPTVCSIAGVNAPAGISGIDVTGKRPGKRDCVFASMYPVTEGSVEEWRMARTDRFKYVACSIGNAREALFDLSKDPGETRNIAGEPGAKGELERHRGLLRDFMRSGGDDSPRFKWLLEEGE